LRLNEPTLKSARKFKENQLPAGAGPENVLAR